MQLLQDKNVRMEVRLEACVTIGSLAKGTENHIELLISCGTIGVLLNLLEESDPRLVDSALCCLRTLSSQDSGSLSTNYNLKHLQRLLILAGPNESLIRQSCVANILSTVCKSNPEQNTLQSVGAISVLSSLLSVDNAAVRVPVLSCIATLCFENKEISKEFCNASCNQVKVPTLLVFLVSRDKPIEMQLGAAQCLTNMHRAGAIPASSIIITFRALPCLVRICQVSQ